MCGTIRTCGVAQLSSAEKESPALQAWGEDQDFAWGDKFAEESGITREDVAQALVEVRKDDNGNLTMRKRNFGGGWNYRVMRTKDGDEDTLCLVEAYYNDKGEVDAVAVQDIPCEVSIELLRKNFERMLDALDKPIIDEMK